MRVITCQRESKIRPELENKFGIKLSLQKSLLLIEQHYYHDIVVHRKYLTSAAVDTSPFWSKNCVQYAECLTTRGGAKYVHVPI